MKKKNKKMKKSFWDKITGNNELKEEKNGLWS